MSRAGSIKKSFVGGCSCAHQSTHVPVVTVETSLPVCAALDLSSFAEGHPDGRRDEGEAVGDSLLLGLHVGLDLIECVAGVDLRDLECSELRTLVDDLGFESLDRRRRLVALVRAAVRRSASAGSPRYHRHRTRRRPQSLRAPQPRRARCSPSSKASMTLASRRLMSRPSSATRSAAPAGHPHTAHAHTARAPAHCRPPASRNPSGSANRSGHGARSQRRPSPPGRPAFTNGATTIVKAFSMSRASC